MKDYTDPLQAAFIELAVQDLQGSGAKAKVDVPKPIVAEATEFDKDAFAKAALQDLGAKPGASVIKEESRFANYSPVEATGKIVEQFIKEAEEETAAALKKMLRGLR